MSRKIPTGILAAALIAAGLAILPTSTQGNPVSRTYFKDTDRPTSAEAAVPDPLAVELGMRIRIDRAGSITGVRFFKGSANEGTHTGSIWSTGGRRLRTITFASESSSGWQQAFFGTPLPVTAGQVVTVSYLAPKGRYASTYNYFTGPSSASGLTTGTGAGVFKYGGTGGFPTRTYRNSNYWVDLTFVEASSPSPTPTPTRTTAPPTPTPSPTPTISFPAPTPTSTRATPPPTATPSPPSSPTPTAAPYSWYPDSTNTGVPSGTPLTPYTGPCVITQANTVIDAKTVNCNLSVQAAGVTITRSHINGSVATYENSSGFTFSIRDSFLDGGNVGGRTVLGSVSFTALRVHVVGGTRSIHCYRDCSVVDSYVHAQMTDTSGQHHESGIRMGQNATIRHNTISCDAPDVEPNAGCSAALTGYGDFAPVRNNLIEGNRFLPTTGGFCAYGGSTQGKPFSGDTANIVFRNNLFERGPGGKCGHWGPIASFDPSAPGNSWTGNVWNDGTLVPAT